MADIRKLAVFWVFLCLVPLSVIAQQPVLETSSTTEMRPRTLRAGPIPPEVSFGILTVGGIGQGSVALSPDGQLIVFSVCDPTKLKVETDPRYKTFTRTGTPMVHASCHLMIGDTRTRQFNKLMNSGASWFPVWSPNGQYVAFFSDQAGAANLWLWDRKSAAVRKVSNAIIRSNGKSEPRWFPDNLLILATALPDGMSIDAAADLSGGEGRSTNSNSTKSEASVTVYSFRPESKNQASPQITSAYDVSQFFGDLVVFDIKTNSKKVIAPGIKSWGYQVAPDGKYVAFTNQKGFTPNSHYTVFDLLLHSFIDGSTTTLLRDFEFEDGRSFSWSPKGEHLSFCGTYPKMDCFILPRTGGELINITPFQHPPLTGFDRFPLWTADAKHVYRLAEDAIWKINVVDRSSTQIPVPPEYKFIDVALPYRAPQLLAGDERSLVAIARNPKTKSVAFYQLDLVTGGNRKLFERDQVVGGVYPRDSLDVTTDGKTIVFRTQDSAHPAELWISDTGFSAPQQLTSVNADAQQYDLGKSKLIEWRGPNGEMQQGVLLFPPGYHAGRRYPVIVSQYPGTGGLRRSNHLNYYGLSGGGGVHDLQLFASRGYLVFLPDTPAPRKGSPMHGIMEALLPAINKLEDLGIADMDRMGIIGGSYGGYAVLSVITQTTRFKAAVARSSQGDLIGAYGYMRKNGDTFGVGWAETGQGGMEGTPWERRDRYIENSPFFYLDRVQTPLLLIHGSEDPLVPAFLADQTFVALRRLGKKVEYAKYEGEGHAEAGWGYANQLDYIKRVISWFDEHLKPAESTNTQAASNR